MMHKKIRKNNSDIYKFIEIDSSAIVRYEVKALVDQMIIFFDGMESEDELKYVKFQPFQLSICFILIFIIVGCQKTVKLKLHKLYE
jgi:hypothetical protein